MNLHQIHVPTTATVTTTPKNWNVVCQKSNRQMRKNCCEFWCACFVFFCFLFLAPCSLDCLFDTSVLFLGGWLPYVFPWFCVKIQPYWRTKSNLFIPANIDNKSSRIVKMWYLDVFLSLSLVASTVAYSVLSSPPCLRPSHLPQHINLCGFFCLSFFSCRHALDFHLSGWLPTTERYSNNWIIRENKEFDGKVLLAPPLFVL